MLRARLPLEIALTLTFNYPYYTSDRLFESTGRGGFTIYPDALRVLDDYFDA
jgi:hypothetical protein